MKERIGNEQEPTVRPAPENGASPEDVGYAPPPEDTRRAPPSIHGSIGHQLVTLAIIGVAVALLMLAAWMGEPA